MTPPQAPPTEALENLSLGGSSRMSRITRAVAKRGSSSVVGPDSEGTLTSERTGICYDIGNLPPDIRGFVSQGFEYAKTGSLGDMTDHSDSGYYVFGFGPRNKPDGAVRIYAAGESNTPIICFGQRCQGLCRHVFCFLDYMLSWASDFRPLDPVTFKADGTFVGLPLPYDMVSQGGFPGCVAYVKDYVGQDRQRLPANRIKELQMNLLLFPPTSPSLEEDVREAAKIGNDKRLAKELHSRFSDLIIDEATRNPVFFVNLERTFAPRTCAEVSFDLLVRRAILLLANDDVEQYAVALPGVFEQIEKMYSLRAHNDEKLANHALRAVISVLKATVEANEEVDEALLQNPSSSFIHTAVESLRALPPQVLSHEKEGLNTITELLKEGSVLPKFIEVWEHMVQQVLKRKGQEQGGSSTKKGKATM